MATETAPEVTISARNNDLNKLAYEIANSEPNWRLESATVKVADSAESTVVNGNSCGQRNGSGI